MKDDFRSALMLAFERGILDLPNEGDRWLMLNAVSLPSASRDLVMSLDCEQGFRPDYVALEQAGYRVKPSLEPQQVSGAIVLAGRNRRINEHNMARAWNALPPGGKLIVAGDKNAGVASLRKWASQYTDVVESFSKFHALVFCMNKQGSDWPLHPIKRTVDEYRLADGMFSADGPDRGSEILASHFTDRIRGHVADFGAGWGYLSRELSRRSEGMESLSLYEADWASLEAAKVNMAGLGFETDFHWCDVTREFRKRPFDWIIMNPPFHSGRAAEPELGKQFISIAASTLPSGGRMLMVANRNLPYEKTIEAKFRAFETLEIRDGFKIIEVRK